MPLVSGIVRSEVPARGRTPAGPASSTSAHALGAGSGVVGVDRVVLDLADGPVGRALGLGALAGLVLAPGGAFGVDWGVHLRHVPHLLWWAAMG